MHYQRSFHRTRSIGKRRRKGKRKIRSVAWSVLRRHLIPNYIPPGPLCTRNRLWSAHYNHQRSFGRGHGEILDEIPVASDTNTPHAYLWMSFHPVITFVRIAEGFRLKNSNVYLGAENCPMVHTDRHSWFLLPYEKANDQNWVAMPRRKIYRKSYLSDIPIFEGWSLMLSIRRQSHFPLTNDPMSSVKTGGDSDGDQYFG